MKDLNKKVYSEKRKSHVSEYVTRYVVSVISSLYFSKGVDLPSDTHVKMANIFKKKLMRKIK